MRSAPPAKPRRPDPAFARLFDAQARLADPPSILSAVLPLADHARSAIRERAARLVTTECLDGLVDDLESGLTRRLYSAASKTMIVELGAAAERGLLVGADANERFAFFCAALLDRTFARQLLQQHPALAARLVKIIENWSKATLEILDRLARDQEMIRTTINAPIHSARLQHAAELGDAHGHGRCVQRLTFENGIELYYKPRPVGMELGASRFIAWCNAHGLEPDLRALQVVDCGDYGWVAGLAAATPCFDLGAVGRFYRRQGAQLATTYLLGATDLHYENIIADGEFPVIVDWETLFQALPPMLAGATGAANRLLNDSVVRTYMLPARVFGGDEPARYADLSALGYDERQFSPHPSLIWKEAGSDAMRLEQGYLSLGAATCLPLLGQERIPATNFQSEIEIGFTQAYEFLLRRKATLLSRRGPLSWFRGRTVRHVFRPTAFYASVLNDSWHPEFSASRQRLSAYIRLRLQGHGANDNADLIASETASIIEGDIPYFGVKVGAKHATARSGARVSVGEDGWRATHARIRRLGRKDRERQIWFHRVAFAGASRPVTRAAAKAPRFGNADLVRLASRLGDQICDLAIRRRERASWLAPFIDPSNRFAPGVVSIGLYSGLAGIAHYLGDLWSVTGGASHRRTCILAINEAIALHDGAVAACPGFYDGSSGLAFTLARLGELLDRPSWKRLAKSIVRSDRDNVALPGDIMNGGAGSLLGAVRVAKFLSDPSLLPDETALDGLLSRPELFTPERCGLAHGKAGLGLALAHYASISKKPGLRRRARSLIISDIVAARRARRSKEPSATGPEMLAWCRGGLGAAWALFACGFETDPAAEIVRALAVDCTLGRAHALCPCHGELGVLEFLEHAARASVPGAAHLHRKVRDEVLARILNGEACADNDHDIESPGLFLGLAGAGRMLLRLAGAAPLDDLLMPAQ